MSNNSIFKGVIRVITKYRLSVFAIALLLYLSFNNADNYERVNFLAFENIDKVVHFLMYFGVASALYIDFLWLKRGWRVLLSLCITLLLAILTEIGQSYFTSTRVGDIYDFLCNIAGGAAAISVAPYTSKVYFKLRKYVRGFFRQ